MAAPVDDPDPAPLPRSLAATAAVFVFVGLLGLAAAAIPLFGNSTVGRVAPVALGAGGFLLSSIGLRRRRRWGAVLGCLTCLAAILGPSLANGSVALWGVAIFGALAALPLLQWRHLH